ncbi:MAG: peroxide stress protein YaaA [Anaerolineae bacterium]
MSKGSVLLLTICSNHKVMGGDPTYSPGCSILDSLPDERAADLRRRRCHVLDLIRNGEISVGGRSLAQAPYNARLAAGPDLGGTSSAVYRPAILRYQGRLYTELGADRQRVAEESTQHLLIISGLYGLLMPSEPIQGYTCHILHSDAFTETWAGDGALTSYVLAYARAHGIRRVFDLTGQSAYRRLLDWDRLARKLDVLHAFGEQNAGPDLLPALGHLASQWLQSDEDTLLSLQDGQSVVTDYERVILVKATEPPEGWPREEDPLQPPSLGPEVDTVVIPVPAEISAEPRDIPLTGGEHTCMCGYPVQCIGDLPDELRQQMQTISRVVHVTGVFLGRIWTQKTRPTYRILLLPPSPGIGRIDGRILGPGKLCQGQDVEIRTTRGHELGVFLAIQDLLNTR